MKKSILMILCAALGFAGNAQQKNAKAMKMTQHIERAAPDVQKAIMALNNQDAEAWYALFSDNATFSDDGRELDFKDWCDKQLFGQSECAVIRIDKVENNGLLLYCLFYSDNYGEFKTYMEFERNDDAFDRLEVGQVEY
ncbi:hypothetical protein K1F50_18960 [Muricauda oceani]|uniref:SnoaL-like domain-containing protein n=1 Tax=Flagellimonas oceani TaxID=2698672 RepID=A0A6G7IYC6_9FLAO|nr:hypothetical protein [Allomuricauda oceani]MBW8244895.1 hypothetical protein [Allomuricauda oceani]QII43556.1 hypothetical protein GVT53_02270 [Allomuricauda oceani]